MEKIKSSLRLFFGVFCAVLASVVVAAAISIGLQSLLVWLGGIFPSVGDCGVLINTILFFLLVLLPFIAACLNDDKGDGNIIVGLLAIIGIYASVVWYFHVGVLFGCIVLLYSCLWRLYKIGADSFWLSCGACAYLFYCIGTYFAMLINGFEPAINVYGIVILSVATLCIVFQFMFRLYSMLRLYSEMEEYS